MAEIQLQVITVKDVLFAGLAKKVEVIEEGWIQTTHMLPIVEGVTVELFGESEQGVLRIGDDQEFEFLLTDEMVQILTEWDNVKPSELFSALYRNRWQSKAVITRNDYSTSIA